MYYCVEFEKDMQVEVAFDICLEHGKALFGWHYLSKATSLIRPHLFYVCYVCLARIAILCYILRHF